MAFITVAAIAGGIGLAGGIAGSVIQGNAARDAAETQAKAAGEATALQREIYNQTRADYEPWRQAGVGALSKLGDADYMRDFTASDFQADPGYDFRMKEGMKALERSAAARGSLGSGGTLKALTRYGQDYASNEYQNAYNRFNADRDRRFSRLSSLAGIGQTATGAVGNAGANYAGQAGQNMMGAANAQAASDIARGSAWGGTLSSLGNQAGNTWMGMATLQQDQKWLDKIYPSGVTNPNASANTGINLAGWNGK